MTDYARRGSDESVFGRGFNSRRLHPTGLTGAKDLSVFAGRSFVISGCCHDLDKTGGTVEKQNKMWYNGSHTGRGTGTPPARIINRGDPNAME